MSNFVLRSTESRQLVVYTDAEKTPEKSFPIPPKGLVTVNLDENQVAYIRANYNRQIYLT